MSSVSHALIKKLGAMLLSLCIGLAMPVKESHASSFSPEQVKAAMLIKLTDFITWPDASFQSNGFIIGVLGDRTIFELLSSIKNMEVQGHLLKVVLLTEWSNGPDLHILYIAPQALDRWKDHIRKNTSKTLLTVSESENFLKAGGILSFTPKQDGRIGFTINRTAQQHSNLLFSSSLLRLAQIYPNGEAP